MTAYQILSVAMTELWSCERVAIELESIGLTKKQVTNVMNQELLKGKPAPVTLAI